MSCRLVSAVVAIACLAAACSSGDDTDATDLGPTAPTVVTATAATATSLAVTTPTPSAPPTTTAPATTEPSATTRAPEATAPPPTNSPSDELSASELADQELARSALIVLADFPDGWVEEPQDDDTDDSETADFEAEFDACLGRDDDERVGDDIERLAVSTGDFHPSDLDTTSVSHEVALAVDEATAITAMSEVAVDGAEPCLADVIQGFYVSEFAKDPELAGIEVGDVTATRTENESEPDTAVGVLLEVPLTIGDQEVSQFLEILYQRGGRALSKLSMSSFGEPFSRDGYDVLSDEITLRLESIGF